MVAVSTAVWVIASPAGFIIHLYSEFENSVKLILGDKLRLSPRMSVCHVLFFLYLSKSLQVVYVFLTILGQFGAASCNVADDKRIFFFELDGRKTLQYYVIP